MYTPPRVYVNGAGEDVSPTEFERLGGRATTKKWKTSVRLLEENGQVGQTLGDWLSVGPSALLHPAVSIISDWFNAAQLSEVQQLARTCIAS